MISFNPNLSQQPIITPFCDQNFKTLRLLAKEVYRLHLKMFYIIASLFYWFFNKDLSFSCDSLAKYHIHRTNDTTICRESEVINFSVNRQSYFQEPSSQIPVWEQLEDRYGKEEIDRWSRLGAGKMPLEVTLKNLSPNKGECFGNSLDFICHYLHLRKKGMTPLDAVKLVSSRYVEGTPKEAQLIQIFGHALKPYKNLKTENMNPLDIADLKRGASHRGDLILEDFLGLKSRWPLEDWRDDSYIKYCIEKSPEEAFLVNIKVKFCKKTRTSQEHAIVFIKTAEDCFIYDPNHATFAVNPTEAIDRLRKIAKKYYDDERDHKDYSMELVPLKLASLPLLEKRS